MIDKINKKCWDKFAKLYAPCMKKTKEYMIEFANTFVLI